MGEGSRPLRETFDEVAALYDRVRPRYPEEMFDDLVRLADLKEAASIVEIGCGTGQATRALARRGYEIVCVELGPNLSAIARARLAEFPGVEVVNAPFESWNPTAQPFDLVFAATSWHWLDPATRLGKAAKVLSPRGRLAIVATHHVLPEEGDPVFGKIQDAYAAIGEDSDLPPRPDEVPDDAVEISSSGLFGEVRVRRYVAAESYSADDYLSLLDTYSGHRVMEPSKRRWLYSEISARIRERPEGRITKHYLFVLSVARRTSESARPPR